MKKVLFSVSALISLSMMAQQSKTTNFTSQETFNSIVFPQSTQNQILSSSCSDTLMNFPMTATLTVYRAGTHGYVVGTNDYNDLEKAEWFAASTYTNISNPVVNGVLVLFYRDANGTKGTMGNPSKSVDLVIYDGDATNGPSTSAGTFTATLGTITAAASSTSNVIYYYYTGSPIPVTTPSVGFFTSVQIPDGTVAGDTAVILSVSVTNNTAWEKWNDNSWNSFTSAWNANMSLAMIPIITGSCVTTSIEQINLDQMINIFPNPANNQTAFVTISLPQETSINVELFDMQGKLVFNKYQVIKTGIIEIPANSLPNGTYMVKVSNGFSYGLRKLVVTH